MAIRDIFKVSRRTFFNPGSWLSWDMLKAQTVSFYNTLRNSFAIPTDITPETFEEAMVRQNLTEGDIIITQIRYQKFAIFFAIVGSLVFFHSFYLLFRYVAIPGWILGLAVSGVLFSQAFRYDFWALQLRERKLGLTFQDWKRHILGIKEEPK